jgi:ADP-ribose pyrophosphatase YjhB (NUDIX family)
MRCIKKITDEDFGLENLPLNNPRIRYGARGIVLNEKEEVAILYKSAKNEYKLVGGGIEEYEDPTKAFKREVLEETGCKVEIDDCLGITEEIKSHDNFKQTSYVYVAHVIENTESLNLTQEEIDDGAILLWLKPEEALEKIKSCENELVGSKHEGNMSIYHTKFIIKRDYGILNYYINNL